MWIFTILIICKQLLKFGVVNFSERVNESGILFVLIFNMRRIKIFFSEIKAFLKVFKLLRFILIKSVSFKIL